MTNDTPSYSAEALLEKYAAERDKRLDLRPEGLSQYVEVSGAFADFYKDPYVEPGFTREAVSEDLDVVIVGAGLSGLMTAAQLADRGIRSVRIIDKAGDFGGTWYWNRYPGAACDVESYIYMPFLEETGYVPTEKYAKADEIFAHCQRIGRHWDLYPRALFQTEVEELRWSDETRRWTVRTNRGDVLTSRFAVVAGGIMHKPKLPGIPGMEKFKPASFHTTRWNYDVTGGSPSAPMDKLADKTVGIIGTGATAIQAVPKLAEAARQLYVFQRTPSAVGVRGNRPTDPEWAKSLGQGWQQQRMLNFTKIMSGEPWDEDLIQDGWTEIYLGNKGRLRTDEEQQAADFEMMEGIRARIDEIVPDKATAEALKPWYHRMCKRPCFHDEYLHAFARPNVKLVDTAGRGIEAMTEDGLVVDGTEYKVDVLIYASGFEMGTSYRKRLGFEIYGRDGVALSDAWADGPHTLHGVFTRGFPNLMMFSTAQGGFAINFAHMISELSIHIATVIRRCMDEGVEALEPTEEAEMEWLQTLMTHLPAWATFMLQCTPSYMNGEGGRNSDMSAMKGVPYFGGPFGYLNILNAWRDEPVFPGVEMRKTAGAAG